MPTSDNIQHAFDQRGAPTETTPLNNKNFASHLHSKMDSDTKKVVIKVAIDVILLLCGKNLKNIPIFTILITICFYFSWHSNLYFLPFWSSLWAWILLWWWIADASVPRINGDKHCALQHWIDCPNNFNYYRGVHKMEVWHGWSERDEGLWLRNSFLGSKRLQIRWTSVFWSLLQSSYHRHRKICNWTVSTAFHESMHPDNAWKHDLWWSDQHASLYRSFRMQQLENYSKKTQRNASIVPKWPLELFNVHDGVCCALSARKIQLERIKTHQTFPAVHFHLDGLVCGNESNFRLQTSL